MSTEWLTVAGAAAFLGCGTSRVYHLVATRALRHYRMGDRPGRTGRIAFDVADLRAYLESCVVEAGEPRASRVVLPPSRHFRDREGVRPRGRGTG